MFAVVSTVTAGPLSIGRVESIHRDLRQAVESALRVPHWMARLVVLEGRARVGEYLGKSSGWRDLDEQEQEELGAMIDELQ